LSERSKIRASAGTGFKAPSFNDLYFPNYGNPDLDPEKVSVSIWESSTHCHAKDGWK
jgi:vitamin B12 transporter